MRCSNCGSEVQGPPKYCPECGKKFQAVPPPVSAGEDGLYFCHKHKKEATRVTCGRCEKPICPRCMVMSPAGVRCRECARRRVALRPRGVLHDVSSGVTRGPVAQRVWYLAIFAFFMSLVSSIFGGRNGDA